MFWDKGYAPSQNIEALLEKENATVEEFLDDEDILQECKTQKKGLINYFTRPEVIRRLVELIITEPSEELPMAVRFRHANMACEILTLGLPSLDEKILSDADTLKSLYSYLENEPPLNPLLSSFFSKTFSMLFTKKAEQDWFLYQQMCLQLLEYIKLRNNFLDLICKHFSTPVIPDLIMQMMKDVEGGSLKRNLYDWLTEEKLVERLISLLGNPQETDKHANVAEFLCDLIQQGRTMRQNDSENDSFEPAFSGSNPILQVIESEATVDALMNVILEPNAQESAIISGISVVLTLIKPVVFVDEPNSDRLKMMQNREKDVHEQILETVISVIAPRLKDFNELLKNPPNKPEIVTTAAKLTPPFGMVRLYICRVFTVLLQTRNEEVSNTICATDFFETLLKLFKQYCWNNFLHSEVEKCLQLIFYTNLSNNNSMQGSTIVNDGSFNKNNSGDNNLSILIFGNGNGDNNGDNFNSSIEAGDDVAEDSNNSSSEDNESKDNEEDKPNNEGEEINKIHENDAAENNEMETETKSETAAIAAQKDEENITDITVDKDSSGDENNAADTTAVHADTAPSALQIHVIVEVKIVSKLIDCWQHNKEMQSAEKGRRLGFMGHLIKIFKHITTCISEFQHIGALIETNLSDAAELELWQSIINPNDGDFTQALAIQNKMLANCNAHEAADYSQHLPKEFLNDNITSDYINDLNPSWTSYLGDQSNGQLLNDVFLALDQEMKMNGNLFQYGRNLDQDAYDDDDEKATLGDSGGGHSLFKPSASTSALNTFGVSNNHWGTYDPFDVLAAACLDIVPASTPWATDFPSEDNFADFDSHFSTFTNDLGESLSAVAISKGSDDNDKDIDSNEENNAPNALSKKLNREAGYDNNANVEKSSGDFESFNKFEDDENAKNEKVAAAASRLVLQDSDDDDYEDDDGIWTKPVGESKVAAKDDVTLGSIDDVLVKYTKSTIDQAVNAAAKFYGPNSKLPTAKDDNNEQLNNSNDITDTPTNEAELNAKEHRTLEIKLEAAGAATDIKIASSSEAVNNVEIAPSS